MKTHRGPRDLPKGITLALGSALLFGATPPLSKLLLETIDPLLLAGLLYLGAGIGLAAYRLVRTQFKPSQSEARLRRADLPWLAAAVFMGGIAGPLLLMLGLSQTTASSASLALNIEGLMTMGIAWLVYHENVDGRLLLGAAAILAGAILLSWDGQGATIDTGTLLVAGACAAWGIDNNLTRKISASDPIVIVMIKGLVAGAVNTGLALATGVILPGSAIIVAAGVVGLFGVGISLVMFVLALRHLGTARTGAYFSLAPFIGAVLAITVLAEPMTLKLLIAAALMGLGLWLHLTERHEHVHHHAALEHEHSHVHDEHHQHQHDGAFAEPHSHWHRHEPLTHAHVHYPDLHHQHRH